MHEKLAAGVRSFSAVEVRLAQGNKQLVGFDDSIGDKRFYWTAQDKQS